MAIHASRLLDDPRSHPRPDDDTRVVRGRFGNIVIRAANRIEFPSGLLGFAGLSGFTLAELPDERYGRFLVLQSLEDDAVSFLVQPLDPESGMIAAEDLDEACAGLGIPRGDLALLLIVSVRKMEDKAVLSVNLRAPLFVHVTRRRGVQHVLPRNTYPIRFLL
jgi:flagellar assembly factor FliW